MFLLTLNLSVIRLVILHLNTPLHGIVTEIHRLPGFSHFLRPPLFLDLQISASGGPVIIPNASQYTCDALIILSENEPVHIPLPTIKLHGLTLHAKFRDVMK